MSSEGSGGIRDDTGHVKGWNAGMEYQVLKLVVRGIDARELKGKHWCLVQIAKLILDEKEWEVIGDLLDPGEEPGEVQNDYGR